MNARAARTIDDAERRARLGRRHRLAASAHAATVEDVVDAVVALHSTDAASVVLSSWARLAHREHGPEAVERALYDERTLVRLLAMRRTTFVVPRALAPVVLSAASAPVAVRERAKLVKFLGENGLGGDDAAAWLAGAEEAALRVLDELGEATAPELAAADERLGAELVLSPGKKYEAHQKVASRVLSVLSAEGRALRARPRGGWTSTQFQWTTARHWLGAPLEPVEPAAARAELARRYLGAFGPARAEDLKWWTGWPLGQARAAIAAAGAVEVALEDGSTAAVLAGDAEPVAEPEPWVALLPALDPTPMGWSGRDWYLGGHAERVFDTNGNVAPTVWCDGRIVGAWAQRDGGEVVVGIVDDVGAEATAAIEAEAAALTRRLDGVRLAPRARGHAPLERELRGV